MRSQVLQGDFSSCEFRPRHGLRFVLPDGEMDMLICFQCNQVAVPGAVIPPGRVAPSLSPVAGKLMNRLLDKHKVERDEPKKRASKQE